MKQKRYEILRKQDLFPWKLIYSVFFEDLDMFYDASEEIEIFKGIKKERFLKNYYYYGIY